MKGNQALRYATKTDKGLRQSNADAVFAGADLFIVADGVGTAKNSDLASKMAVSKIHEAFDLGASLQQAVQLAHGALQKFNVEQTMKKAVGSTVVTAALTRSPNHTFKGEIVWAGDSRAYVIDLQKSQVTQLTQDHSYVNTLVQRGDITQEQADSHPQRNIITRCLGLTQAPNIELDSQEFTLQQDQVLLLCSDGLSGLLNETVLLTSLQQAQTLNAAADTLLQQALKAGSQDNISLVLARM